MKFKFRKRLYISAELRNIILSNLGIGGISYGLDIYGCFDFTFPPALIALIIGTIDTLLNAFLIIKYIKKNGNHV